MAYHYIFDAASLLEKSLVDLQEVIQHSESLNHSHYRLYDFREALALTERLLYEHVRVLLEDESFRLGSLEVQTLYSTSATAPSLASCVDILRSVAARHGSHPRVDFNSSVDGATSTHVDSPHSYYPKRNATDSLLFRLVVALQLCRVRLSDAKFVITGRRHHQTIPSSRIVEQLPLFAVGCCAAVFVAVSYSRRIERNRSGTRPYLVLSYCAAQVGLVLVSANWLTHRWGIVWMTAKIEKSMREIEAWNQQWYTVQSTPAKKRRNEDPSIDAAKSRRLIEYALAHVTPKASYIILTMPIDFRCFLPANLRLLVLSQFSLWQSQGELRFLVLKRAMDVFYASVGTAMKVTNGTSESDAANWQMTLVTAAVASFYTLTGARKMAEEVTSSSESARNLIHHAWGMVSLPALKTISLQASRLVKGAAVADRLEIAGVSCFVLCREPAPELAAATKRFHRTHYSRNATSMHALTTIDEQEEHTPESLTSTKPFARTSARYRQRDVILHLTGGGFFAHIIASDLPYLLDWSASTGSVVICPEYDLLPQHTFPDALLQVECVYKSLRSGEAVHALGFEANRIVLTGESTGGTLAAALLVKLCMDADGTPTCLSTISASAYTARPGETFDTVQEQPPENSKSVGEPVLPCALVLSCPVLNLHCSSVPCVVGNQDPVLPSGLLSAICDAYLPRELGISKKNPLASPFYASDSILSRFPPTLVFASSNDPVLDDSVVLNQRLRSLGVESDLRAAQNLPHAYLGLGTAGFPEAQEVQRQLVDWLNFQLNRGAQEEA
jgi:acetyl esterase/lipase